MNCNGDTVEGSVGIRVASLAGFKWPSCSSDGRQQVQFSLMG